MIFGAVSFFCMLSFHYSTTFFFLTGEIPISCFYMNTKNFQILYWQKSNLVIKLYSFQYNTTNTGKRSSKTFGCFQRVCGWCEQITEECLNWPRSGSLNWEQVGATGESAVIPTGYWFLQPVSGKVYSFSGIKKSGTAEISGLSSLNEGDEGLFLLLIAHSNHAYKRTKDKIKQKTHAEF